MNMICGLLLIISTSLLYSIGTSAAEKKSYRGYKGIRLWLNSDPHVQAVRQLETEDKLRFWDEVTINGHTDVIVSPETLDSVLKRTAELSIKSELLVDDLQEGIDNETSANRIAKMRGALRSPDGRASPDTYFATYSEIVTWMRQLQALYPTLAQVFTAGTTYLGQTIYGIRLGTQGASKQNIMIEACIHSREWLACATANWIIKKLLTESSSNSNVQNLLRQYYFHFIPVANVDGHDYTFSTDRFHRKTVKPNPGYSCVGSDPNRNWDNHFGESGTSSYPCSDTYPGEYAFSEIEAKSLANLMHNLQPKIYFSIHAFSQLWLLPWGYTYSLPPDYTEMLRVANIGSQALTAVNGLRFRVGNIANTIYPASGSTVDYAYDNAGILYSSCWEVRPTGGGINGFAPAPNQIDPSGREIYAAMIAYIQNVR
jgi:murein tripeptide amidase MpaA